MLEVSCFPENRKQAFRTYFRAVDLGLGVVPEVTVADVAGPLVRRHSEDVDG